MAHFCCPVCGHKLEKREKTFSCTNSHSFDIAKKEYVNLKMACGSKSCRHGDDKVMVKARRDFLEAGYYKILADKICLLVSKYFKGGVILDAGCGEGYYTANIAETVPKGSEIFGIDISKNALEMASRRGGGVMRAVASIFKIPMEDDSCDMLLNIFSPYCDGEYRRVLKRNGIMVRVIPLENHLWELKKAVYEKPYKNECSSLELDGFELMESAEIKDEIVLENQNDTMNLFMMTPYYYKTSREDFAKLAMIKTLKTQIEFGILIYSRI